MTRAQQLDRYDPGKLANGLADDAEAFCRYYFPDGRRVGNYWQMADISGAKGRSLMIRLRDFGGKRAGKWTEYVAALVMLRLCDCVLFDGLSRASTQHNVRMQRGVL